ncbi:MAG TPA: TolC family protein [Paraburkholderia sp.]
MSRLLPCSPVRPRGGAIALAAAACLALLLPGCATYRAQPLATHSSLLDAQALARVQIDPATMPLPELAAHRFDPADGFDIEDVAMLAVANNPDLKLARDDLGIAQAQAYSAGLLPDPQLAVSSDYPGQLGLSRAFSYGLSMDVMALVTRSANVHSAEATVHKTDLGLLWQEWQIVAQARQLFIKSRFQDAMLPLLAQQEELARTRHERTARAAQARNVTADVVAGTLVSLQDARKQYADMQQAREQTRHDLNSLLGLAPDVELPLVGPDAIEPVPDATIDAALAALPARRPDLLALQAGYEAQEAKYRAAILNQFPSLSVGFVRARDTSEIYTSGFQISMSLPIFNRNRGNIAIEQATRKRLEDEYQTRLNAAVADVAHLRANNAIIGRQLADGEASLAPLQDAASHAHDAYAAHGITLGQYADAQSAALARTIDVATLRESLAEQRVGLQALLGSAIPDPASTATTTSANR